MKAVTIGGMGNTLGREKGGKGPEGGEGRTEGDAGLGAMNFDELMANPRLRWKGDEGSEEVWGQNQRIRSFA